MFSGRQPADSPTIAGDPVAVIPTGPVIPVVTSSTQWLSDTHDE